MRWRSRLCAVLILVGLVCRFTALDGKIYGHDEAYTSLRAAGHRRVDIDATLFVDQVWTPAEVNQFQQFKPASTLDDTLRSLAIEDPHHPPFYFVMARAWMQQFGSSLTSMRLLPALWSVVALPLMFALAWVLFRSPTVAWWATTLLALSPFDLQFAQTSRQYSLMTVLVLASTLCFWHLREPKREAYAFLSRSIKTSPWWLVGYVLTSALGLYTHLFFAFTLVAHGVYALGTAMFERRGILRPYLGAMALTSLLYAPWIAVILENFAQLRATTGWAAQVLDGLTMLKYVALNLTVFLFDLDWGFNNPLTYIPRLLLIGLLLLALSHLSRKAPLSVSWLLLALIVVPFVILLIPDLLGGGKRSTITRYLLGCYPALQLMLAFYLADVQKRMLSQQAMTLLVLGMLASLGVYLASPTWWSKELSVFNAENIARINATDQAILVSDLGYDYTNTGDLLAMSFDLAPQVRLALLNNLDQPVDLTAIPGDGTVFVFRPSEQMWQAFEAANWQIEAAYIEGQLFIVRDRPVVRPPALELTMPEITDAATENDEALDTDDAGVTP